MIAEPLRFYNIIGNRLYLGNIKTLKDVFDSTPAEIERLITCSANFYIHIRDFEIMKSQSEIFEFCTSSLILNDLKNHIYFTYFNASCLTQKPKEITWLFLKHFMLSYKSILYTPVEPLESQDVGRLSLEEVEENILLNQNFFLKNQELQRLASTISEFNFSRIAILLNELKNENHYSYLQELQNNSRLNWEQKSR